MTQPVWDGDGRDPWLPARLDARINAGDAERSIRRAFWAALSGWLVETARRVLRGQRPDLEVIWARVPAWADAVDQVVRGAIRPAMGSAYKVLLGRDVPWDQRPFASAYLAEVRNRWSFPDRSMTWCRWFTGGFGEGGPDARRVDDVLSTTASERWPNRATVVARTEAIGALNAGRYDAFQALAEETGDEFEKVWLATTDSRTRPSHAEADGQRVPVTEPFMVGGFALDFPGDPNGPPQEVIQCRCTMLLVEPGEFTDMSNRQFLGGA